MKKLILKIPFKAKPDDYDNLENLIPYVCKSIKSYSINRDNEEVEVGFIDEKLRGVIKKQLLLLFNQVKPAKENEEELIYFKNDPGSISYQGNAYTELLSCGDITKIDTGYYSLQGNFLNMIKCMDRKILEFSQIQNACEVDYPVTISLGSLSQGHFFDRTPQFANFISTIRENFENISILSKELKKNIKDVKWNEHLNNPSHMCRSAVCLNSYPTFSNKIIHEPVALTTVGKVFRNESTQVDSLERMFEFTVRDTIYFGTPDWVNNKLDECLEWYKKLILDFNLKANIQYASDPFFVDNIKNLQFYQKAEQSKSEIRIFIPKSNKDISIGS